MPPDNFSKEAKKHVREAWRNYCLYERWLEHEPSWALVLLFYSAVHLVQAHAINLGATNPRIIVPADHLQRRRYIAERLQRIIADYGELQTASENVRYSLVRYSRVEALSYYAEEFSQIVEDLHNKGVSWEIRLTAVERNAVLNEGNAPT